MWCGGLCRRSQTCLQPASNMRIATRLAAAATLCLLIGWVCCCEPEQAHSGCKLQASGCSCGYGCKYDYPFRSKRECMVAYRERNSNICSHSPCVRGTCLQVNQGPGYACRCEGTGYYGQRCEKACPTVPVRGLTFPVECIVI